MKKYEIRNIGCDDTTVTIIELSDDELKVIVKFAKLNNKNSEYGCQPAIDILDENDEYIVNCEDKGDTK